MKFQGVENMLWKNKFDYFQTNQVKITHTGFPQSWKILEKKWSWKVMEKSWKIAKI